VRFSAKKPTVLDFRSGFSISGNKKNGALLERRFLVMINCAY